MYTTLNIASIKADPVLLTAAREACHRILFNFINSNAVNGISADSVVSFGDVWWQPMLVALEVIFIVLAVGCSGMYIASVIMDRRRKNG